MMSQEKKPDLWIILDNSDTPAYDWSIAKDIPWIRYVRVYEKKSIGALRNTCLELALDAGAEYIVFWDDDDYYPPTRISAGIHALEANPDADISASSRMFLYLVRENVMLEVGPYGEKHGTAATYTIRRRYAEANRFLEKTRGEELEFTQHWSAKLVQVEAEKMIVVIGHGRNTVDKSDLLRNPRTYCAKIVNAENGKMTLRARWPLQWDLFRSTFFDARCDQPRENSQRVQSPSAEYLIPRIGGIVGSVEHRA